MVAKSGPAGLILVAKSGPPGPYLSAKNGPTLPKTVRFSSNEFVLNKTRKACPSNFSGLIAQLYNIWGTYTVYIYINIKRIIHEWNEYIVHAQYMVIE